MKITIGRFSLDILLPFRLWLPSTVFIVLCVVLFFLHDMLLLKLDDVAPNLIGVAWWSLLFLYIIAGVAFTYFYARFFRFSFASEDARSQRIMAVLSGLPFYALWFLFLLNIMYYMLTPNDLPAAAGFAGVVGSVGFALVSGAYLLLLRFFLRRLTATAHE